jgi:RNA polymerase sigma-70 factor (ECF subfamily)
MAIRTQRAERDLYEGLVRRHAAELYRFARRLGGDPALAEDLVQETFQAAWSGLDRLREPERARAWLFQILRHRWSHALRGRGRAASARQALAQGTGPSADPRHVHESADLLQRGLDQLDERLRVPLLMVFLEGLTCQETAHELGLPLGTVLSRIHRARRRLRDLEEERSGPRLRAIPAVQASGSEVS